MQVTIKRGLNLPIRGVPEQVIQDEQQVGTVAVMGRDYVGLKPTMLVAEGDAVSIGQPLFADKKNPGVSITSPGGGTVRSINRGARRVLQSVIIDLDEHEAARSFNSYPAAALADLDRQTVIDDLLDSGLWTALRARPYSKVARPDSSPQAIFVTAIETNPLGADPSVIIAQASDDFVNGLQVISRLTEGKIYVCRAAGDGVPVADGEQFVDAEFAGPHPAGLVGTHIHFLHPVSATRAVWHLNYQDVIAIGRQFTTGSLSTERVVAIGGPPVQKPRLVRTRLGASIGLAELGPLDKVECRAISGSPLGGYRAAGWAAYLGRYHLQVAVLREGRERELFGWIRPGHKKHSITNVFVSSFYRKRPLELTTSQNGSPRAMVPIGSYERVMPLDILPTQLLRAIMVGDTDVAQQLGALELDEEDLALCAYVCPGKHDYGPLLRESLEQIEKEG